MKKTIALCLLVSIIVAACDTSEPTPTDASPVSSVLESPQPSEPEATSPAATDAGVDAARTSDASLDANDYGPKTQGECITVCEREHKIGASLAADIDKCWIDKCSPACTDDMVADGTVKPPSVGDCTQAVKTPSIACSDCTVTNCCSAWDATFSNPEGVALNQCVVACYAKFPQ